MFGGDESDAILRQVNNLPKTNLDEMIGIKQNNSTNLKQIPKPKEKLQKSFKREPKSTALLIDTQHLDILPPGWTKKIVQRTVGATAGKYDVYFDTPTGRKLRSKNEIKSYCEKNNLEYDPKVFAFARPKVEGEKVKKVLSKTFSPSAKRLKVAVEVESPMANGFQNDTVCENGFQYDILNGSSYDTNLETANDSNIDEEFLSLAKNCLGSFSELDLPNTSFKISSEAVPVAAMTSQEQVLSANSSQPTSNGTAENELASYGKRFKIERPLSFSCF